MALRDAAFTISNGRALKRRGLTGYEIMVRLDGNILTFSDEDGRTVAVPASQVDRLRFFRMDPTQARYGGSTPAIYETKIWWDGGRWSILLVAVDELETYRAAIRAFAGQVAAARGLDRIRLGPGWVTAIVNLLLVVPITLALFAYIFYVAIEDGGWWWVSAIVVFLAFAWIVGRNLYSRWPRRLRSLEQLDAELKITG